MALADRLARVNRAAVSPTRGAGELFALPDGGEAAGMFDPVGTSPGGWGSEVGLTGRLSAQNNAMLSVSETTAALMSEKDTITVRGEAYIVVAMNPDGHGIVECSLMPVSASGTDPLSAER